MSSRSKADASKIAAIGFDFLSQGDTESAADYYRRAGDIMMMNADPNDTLEIFLAASQYYHGGHYEKAYCMIVNIKPESLPERYRDIFINSLVGFGERCNFHYKAKIKNQIQVHLFKFEYKEIIDLLIEHPYVLSRARMAEIRAMCLKQMGDMECASDWQEQAKTWVQHA